MIVMEWHVQQVLDEVNLCENELNLCKSMLEECCEYVCPSTMAKKKERKKERLASS
jgi:hypothetical protein